MVMQPATKTYTGYALSVLIQFNGDKFGVLARWNYLWNIGMLGKWDDYQNPTQRTITMLVLQQFSNETWSRDLSTSL